MPSVRKEFKYSFVAAVVYFAAGIAMAQNLGTDLTNLYQSLRQSDATAAAKVEADIRFKWAASGSQTVDLLLKRGMDALRRNEPQRAADHLTAAIDFAPDFTMAYVERAKSYLALGYLGPAVQDLQTTVRLDPNHFDAIALLGQVFERLGENDLALETYDQALAIHPHFDQVKGARDALQDAMGDTAL